MASDTEIANLAISHLGVGKEISNLTTEKSEEARACRRFYNVARDQTLRDHSWPFARREVNLSLIQSFTTTASEWTYSYRYPSDAVKIIRIISDNYGNRNPSRQGRIPYKIAGDSSARIIYTDEENAKCEYIKRETDEGFYPSDFEMAFSYRLARLIAPRLTSGDPFGLVDRMEELYRNEIRMAQVNSMNEEQVDENPASELERSRGGHEIFADYGYRNKGYGF
jgi:hypothetical protein